MSRYFLIMIAAVAVVAGSVAIYKLAFFCSASDISGHYFGDIAGGGQNSETIFSLDNDGNLTGKYTMSDNPSQPGTFSKLTIDENILVGEWADQFGNGKIKFTFKEDCKSFAGFWNEVNPWAGSK